MCRVGISLVKFSLVLVHCNTSTLVFIHLACVVLAHAGLGVRACARAFSRALVLSLSRALVACVQRLWLYAFILLLMWRRMMHAYDSLARSLFVCVCTHLCYPQLILCV
jgi:hypothetical protein